MYEFHDILTLPKRWKIPRDDLDAFHYLKSTGPAPYWQYQSPYFIGPNIVFLGENDFLTTFVSQLAVKPGIVRDFYPVISSTSGSFFMASTLHPDHPLYEVRKIEGH